MKTLRLVSTLACMCLLPACNRQPTTLPGSTATPYEVIVVGDAKNEMADVLSAPMSGLPQPEPTFEVKTVKHSDFKGKMQFMRNVLIARTDKNRNGAPTIHYQRNRYARPQLVVYIDARSVAELKQYGMKNGRQIRQLFVMHEYALAVKQLERKNNAKARQLVRTLFGHDMAVPADMTWHKQGKNFLWLSNNAAQGMQNYCIYTLDTTEEPSKQQMDSVLRVNMKGQTDHMYMQTVWQTVEHERIHYDGQTCHIQRGLWEMVGDAMGGPFVRRILTDSTANKTLVIEAFVYAPESKKRNRLREIEAALLTIKQKQPKGEH